MKTITQKNSSTYEHVRCVLCGDAIDRNLEYLIWEEKESRFWLCQKCSSMLTAKEEVTGEYPELHHQN